LFSTKISLSLTKQALILIFIAGVFGVVGNVFLLKSIESSLNPGYSLAVSGVHILLVTIASIFLFKSEFTLFKGMGALLAVIGIILLGF